MVQAALITAILVCACLSVYGTQFRHRRIQYIFKPLTTILTLSAALALPAIHPPYYRVLVAIGLVFSLVGDVCLMLPRVKFELGLASFLVALLLYTAAFTPGSFLGAWWLLPLVFTLLVVTSLIWSRLGKLRWPVVAYELAMVSMAWRALARWEAMGSRAALLAAIGAVLFLVSDSLLAINRFRDPLPLASVLVLGTYHVGQLLIALSV